MYSHFNVILLCFSSVYCISSQIENLNSDGLLEILNGETIIKEWETAMDQEIFYNDNIVNVRQAVDEFKQKAENDDVTEFGKTHDIIKTAYQCTLMKYASLSAYLIVHDVRTLINTIKQAVDEMNKRHISFDPETIFNNPSFQKFLREVGSKQYHLDFDIIFRERTIRLLGTHKFDVTPWKEWHNVWAKMIMKNLSFKMKYNIYSDVFEQKFPNERDLPDVDVLNEIVCVLNEAIQLFDNFVVNNCVRHKGSFKKNFQSLKKGVNNDVVKFTSYIDKKIQGRSPHWALYKDYSIQGPGTSQAVDNIRGSGGFVNNVEFEVSGLKMNVQNTKNPTDIYGLLSDGRTSETVLKFTRSVPHPSHIVNIGMIWYRDSEFGLQEEQARPENYAVGYHTTENLTHVVYR